MLLNDLFHNANPEIYCRETLVLIRKFTFNSSHLFSLVKQSTQTDDEFYTTLLFTMNNVLEDFYYLYQKLFIELKFSSFRGVVDYFHGVEFHPCFECFDWLLQIPNLVSGLPVDEKQQVNLNKEHILYVSLKKFYYENRAKISKRIRDYELVEKNGYDKIIAVYEFVQQKQLANSTSSPSYMDITAYEFTLCFDQFSSWPLFYAVISRIYKELNKWCKQANVVMVRKLFLDIEKKAIVFKVVTLGFAKCSVPIERALTKALAEHPKVLKTLQRYLLIDWPADTGLFYKKVQAQTQYLFALLAEIKQQYSNSAEELSNVIGELASLKDSVALVQKFEQLQRLDNTNANQETIKHYFTSIQQPELNAACLNLYNFLIPHVIHERKLFNNLGLIFKDPHECYHTSLPSIYSFQIVNTQALINDNTEKEKEA